MWVIYDHPTDFPDHFVGRLHYSLPEPEPTPLVLLSDTLEKLQQWFAERGFIQLERHPDDDTKIVETWMC